MNHLNSSQELQEVSHLKRHVFQEMCSAVVPLVLITTASVDPEAHLSVVRDEDPNASEKHISRHPNTNNDDSNNNR